ncbi:helix-turn-helix domain-containing protein [Mangrovibacillus cuniculi]|uniref:Helix-turn-helix domain-containing protein n=1 Tax=Mangrovibacillus cuniculi TaxID=2593652 RepID=A0A7S8CC86_9BACI|nr:helix-turn-helix transcriptional regulator [Mangrovibacillus cuniculi]QPC47143.1 helix-turn-helix domain-containing protein [Mangrovibacillus cuniculi]
MNNFGDRLRELRQNKDLSIDELVIKLNSTYNTTISKSMISRYENGQSDPKMENVRVIADYFKVSSDFLLGIEENINLDLSSKLNLKDERDIKKELQKMIDGLEGKNGYAAFDGGTLDDLDEEDKELLIASLENSLRLAKRLSKEKFTPKKYQDKE